MHIIYNIYLYILNIYNIHITFIFISFIIFQMYTVPSTSRSSTCHARHLRPVCQHHKTQGIRSSHRVTCGIDGWLGLGFQWNLMKFGWVVQWILMDLYGLKREILSLWTSDYIHFQIQSSRMVGLLGGSGGSSGRPDLRFVSIPSNVAGLDPKVSQLTWDTSHC